MDVVDAGDRVAKGDGGHVGCGDWVAVEMGEGVIGEGGSVDGDRESLSMSARVVDRRG